MFPSDYEEFIYKGRYARWVEDLQRREDWPETVSRYVDYMGFDSSVKPVVEKTIKDFDVMPSMRALMTAGEALDRANIAGYNCSFLTVDHPYAFDEAMYILLCGTGVGFSVESRYTRQLPVVPQLEENSNVTILVQDSKEGWAYAERELIDHLYKGIIPNWDTSLVRDAGTRLKTFGGRASGPEPLISLFEYTVELFKQAQGRRLRPIECHGLMCKIGEIVVVGGVRRSAMISLSDLDDEEMENAKSGNWWETHPEYALANNSAVYEGTPDADIFSREWAALINSKSGERGIFNRAAARAQVAKSYRRDANHEFGTNPCSEIILRPHGLCNLSEVVCRAEVDLETLLQKVTVATIIGTYQSNLVNFDYLRPRWRKNAEEERLLGVSLTGIMDHPVLNGSHGEGQLVTWLKAMKRKAIDTNRRWADKLGIPRSAGITCVKPSGTVSQLVNSASGIHSRHSHYYIRTVRGDRKDPLTQFMIDQGVPCEPCVMKGDTTLVFSFPIKAPDGAITRNDRTSIQELEHWMLFQEHWCEHKPSATITVRDHEWMEVGAWIHRRFEKVSGVSFLPHSDHVYQQAPYQECSKAEYEEALKKMPTKIDWSVLSQYEIEDNTVAMQTLACTASVCEI